MCGIAAQLNRDSKAVEQGDVRRMAGTLAHRGPDSEGYHFSRSGGLGFRRLSIIDLEGGGQPIFNESRSIAVVVNGEIYNYKELRADLEKRGHIFRSHSDAEVTVHLYEEYGEEFVSHLRGMFGLVILDSERDLMVVARDRLGIKPVYFAKAGPAVLVASEMKAILAHPSMTREANPQAMHEYLSMRYCLEGETFFKGVQSLAPGHLLVVDKTSLEVKPYWSDRGVVADDMSVSEGEGILSAALRESVELHLNADVPVGMFLSGGLDSTTLLAYASEISDRPIRTFTASFGEASGVDESPFAAVAAKHFNTDHNRIDVSPVDCSVLEELVWHLDQPIGDPAILPTWLLARAASREVKVVLTGEGSDEVNGGYNRYLRYWRASQLQPYLGNLPAAVVRRLGKLPIVGGRIGNVASILGAKNELGRFLVAQGCDWQHGVMAGGAVDPARAGEKLDELVAGIQREEAVDRLQQFDRQTWMVADLLPKVDRMTMAHGLEARVPFLDHVYLEAATRIPARLRVNRSGSKQMLRKIASNRVPDEIVQRGQHGFNVPLENWFRDDFQAMAEMALGRGGLQQRDYFNANKIAAILQAYRAKGEGGSLVWSLVLLELWFRRFID